MKILQHKLLIKTVLVLALFVLVFGLAAFKPPEKAEAVVAVLNIFGAESGDLLEAFSFSSGVSTTTSVKRSGSYSFLLPYTSSSVNRTIDLGQISPTSGTPAGNGNLGNPAYISLFFQISALPGSAEETLGTTVNSSSVQKMRWAVNSSGNILVYDSDNALLDTSTATIAVNTWYRLDIKSSSSADGAWAIKIYNDPVTGNGAGSPTLLDDTLNGTGNFATGGSIISLLKLGRKNTLFNSDTNVYFDDILMSTVDYPGDARILGAVPEANGSTMQWTSGTGASDYTQVNERPGSSTQYVANPASGANEWAVFDFPSSSAITSGASVSDTIVAIKVHVTANDNNSGVANAFKSRLRSGSQNSDSAGRNLLIGDVASEVVANTDPNTSAAWTTAGIDEVEAGGIETNTAVDRMTQVILQVAYVPVYDSTPPTVSITAPEDEDTVTGASVTVSADASDNIGVVGVQFKLDGANLQAEDTSSPYSITWDTTAESDGGYDLTAVARDAAGNSATSSTVTVTVDNTAPGGVVVSSIRGSALSPTSAIVRWETDEASTSYVYYGNDTFYGSVVWSDDLVTAHAVTLTGLIPSTAYYYKIRSTDALGLSLTDDNNGAGHTFNTPDTLIKQIPNEADNIAPLVANVLAVPADRSAQITWVTDEEASSIVAYGFDDSYPYLAGDPSSFVANHSVSLTNLTPSRTYHYQVISLDNSGNQGQSADLTFKTLAEGETEPDGDGASGDGAPAEPDPLTPDNFDEAAEDLGVENLVKNASLSFIVRALEALARNPFIGQVDEDLFINAVNELAPRIVSAPNITGANPTLEIGTTFVRASWTTDKRSNSIVGLAASDDYRPGLNNPYQLEAGNIDELVLEHLVYIPNLLPDTLYHYEVKSKSELGNWTSSGDRTFRTLAISGDISNFRFTRITEREADIFWSTAVPTASSIEVTDTQSGQRSTQTRASYLRDHEFNIVNLRPGGTYNLRITSRDQNGRTTTSPVFPFTTILSNLPPQISNVRVITALIPGKVEKVQSIITWGTDKPSTSKVFFEQGVSTAEEPAFSTEVDLALVLNHVVVTTEFKPGAVYRFRVESIDSLQNRTLSDNFSVLTPRPSETVFDLIFDNFEDIFGFLRR